MQKRNHAYYNLKGCPEGFRVRVKEGVSYRLSLFVHDESGRYAWLKQWLQIYSPYHYSINEVRDTLAAFVANVRKDQAEARLIAEHGHYAV